VEACLGMPASSIAASTSYTTDDWLRAAIAAATTSMLQPTRPLWNRRREPAGVLVHHQATGKDACSLNEGRRVAQSKRCNSGGASRLLALLSGCLALPLGRDPVTWHAFEYGGTQILPSLLN